MDRYVLVLSFCQSGHPSTDDHKCLEPLNIIYNRLLEIPNQDSVKEISEFPACSLSGIPATPRWYFAAQACRGATQFCSTDWEELGTHLQKTDSENESLSTPEECLTSLNNQEGVDLKDHPPALAELLEEAADGLHQLTDKLPPPGKALLDVVLVSAEPSPAAKDLLPLLGAVKHMTCWHAAKINIVTENINGWETVSSSLSAGLIEPAELLDCIDCRELWRGGLVIRENKYVSELRFDGFFLRSPVHQIFHSSPLQAPTADHKSNSEVFHYYAPVLDLAQMVDLSELPTFLMSNTQFELGLCGKSLKAKLLLDQLRALRGKVGALFSLSCIISPIAKPPACQLSSQRWKECLSHTPKSFPVPDVEVKGERAVYFLLIQGTDDVGSGTCRVRMMHSHTQLNGAAAMATVSSLLQEKPLLSGRADGNFLHSLTCLQGDSLIKRERKIAHVQTLVLKEYLRQKEEASVPINDLKAMLNLARELYLKMFDSKLPTFAESLKNNEPAKHSELQDAVQQPSDWPGRTVLHNIENLQRRRQRKRLGLLGPGSSESLLGPKDSQRGSSALLDARELLKHFTSDGFPTGDLQPLAISRGNNMFQLSPDLSPRRISRMPFSQASSTHYHGIEFCLDDHQSLDRDQAFLRLQSRLIRYETQTTCSKEPPSLPFALSPAPSPAVVSEPGSVPDGETLQNNDVVQLKRRSWDIDAVGGYPRKRLAKSESSDSLCSQSSGSSGTHPAIRSLRQQANRSQSVSSCTSVFSATKWPSGLATLPYPGKPKLEQQKVVQGQAEEKSAKESRSQKHNRMLLEIVAKMLKPHGITAEHECFEACSKRLFDICKFYLKDLKTSRGLHDEMKKAASSNVKQVVDWVLEKSSKKRR